MRWFAACVALTVFSLGCDSEEPGYGWVNGPGPGAGGTGGMGYNGGSGGAYGGGQMAGSGGQGAFVNNQAGGTGGIGGTGGLGGTGGAGGLGNVGGTGGMGGFAGAPGGGDGMNVMTAGEPRIPQVNGECPSFTSSSISVGGNSGIALEAGPKAAGGGSLIFYWHGTGSSAGEYRGRMADAVAELKATGGLLVSPQGSVGTGGDCSGTNTFAKDDFNWADQIVACAVRDHNIDPRRIYTTGCSAGGLQAGCMASLRSSYIAAAAPNSGGIVRPQSIEDPTNIPALMTMHGGAGDNVIVNFEDTSNTLGNQFKGEGGFWVDCNHMAGHCRAPGDLYAAAWEFMKAHPFGVGMSPYAGGLPQSFPPYCMIK